MRKLDDIQEDVRDIADSKSEIAVYFVDRTLLLGTEYMTDPRLKFLFMLENIVILQCTKRCGYRDVVRDFLSKTSV